MISMNWHNDTEKMWYNDARTNPGGKKNEAGMEIE